MSDIPPALDSEGRATNDDRVYREFIDRLVRSCRAGQGQIGPERARAGVWNQSATAVFIPEQHEVNLLLARLSPADREIMARMLLQAYESAMHDALVVLHEAELPPFDKAYEGTPFHDFVGRLDDWEWPDSAPRT